MEYSETERLIGQIEQYTGKTILKMEKLDSRNGFRHNFIITLSSGKKYLCKSRPFSKRVYEALSSVRHEVPEHFQKIVYLWNDNEETIVMLAEWVEGVVMEWNSWPFQKEQYADAIRRAAALLRKGHRIRQKEVKVLITPEQVSEILDYDWISTEYREAFGKYILKHLDLLNGRQKTVIHADLHLKNMIYNPENGNICIIDTEDVAYDDPYSDLVYAANLWRSPKEQKIYYLFLTEYFEGIIPDYFWKIVNCYSIQKAIYIEKNERENALTQQYNSLKTMWEQHQGMTEDIPEWFAKIRKGIK